MCYAVKRALLEKRKRRQRNLPPEIMRRKGMTKEEAIEDIYETAVKTNREVNAIWGIENE